MSQLDLFAYYLFRVGEITSYCTIVAVMPSFFICKMDHFAARAKLKTIRFEFLLVLFLISNFWLSYFQRIDPPNQVFIAFNQTRVVLSAGYLVTFLAICIKENEKRTEHILKIAAGIGFVWLCTVLVADRHFILTIALVFEMVNNVMQIGAVPKILKTKHRDSVNVPVAVCCFIDASIWFIYACCKGDPVFLLLNGAGLMQGALKYHLYHWVHDNRSDQDWVILNLRRYFRLGINIDEPVVNKKLDISDI